MVFSGVATAAALAGAFVAVPARFALGASATATSEFLLVRGAFAAGAAFAFTLTALPGGALTAGPARAVGLVVLVAFAGGAAAFAALAGGFCATTACSAFFRTALAAALTGAGFTASEARRAFGAGWSRDLLGPARAMSAFLSSGSTRLGPLRSGPYLERGILPA